MNLDGVVRDLDEAAAGRHRLALADDDRLEGGGHIAARRRAGQRRRPAGGAGVTTGGGGVIACREPRIWVCARSGGPAGGTAASAVGAIGVGGAIAGIRPVTRVGAGIAIEAGIGVIVRVRAASIAAGSATGAAAGAADTSSAAPSSSGETLSAPRGSRPSVPPRYESILSSNSPRLRSRSTALCWACIRPLTASSDAPGS